MARFKVPDRSIPVRWRGALDGLLPYDHLARFIWNTLCGFDFGELEGLYPSVRGGAGRPPYHPRLMAALWIYGMSQGLETAAGIAEACRLREDFQWLAGGLCPSDQTLLNFLTRARDRLVSLWVQVLKAMQAAGLVDLSLLAEDGTKMRANASPRSFRTIDKISTVIEDLDTRLAARLDEVAERNSEETDRKAAAEIASLRSRLVRAQRAKEELKVRIARREAREPKKKVQDTDAGHEHRRAPGSTDSREPIQRTLTRFDKTEFYRDNERDVLICPADEELRLIGEYPTEKGHGSYKLYGRRDCTNCPLKSRCTTSRGRRVKIAVESSTAPEHRTSSPEPNHGKTSSTQDKKGKAGDEHEPTASLTEPEAAWMKATSRKRWEPCFNADITVTQGGIIVSQFLTNDCTDFHHFTPALAFVTETLGKPECWVGDGHYGTEANLILADREGVELYAPKAGVPGKSEGREPGEPFPKRPVRTLKSQVFNRGDFDHHPDRDALLCPADQELRFIGEYPTGNRRGTYRLYGRRNCTGCPLKERCTRGQGRRVRMPGTTKSQPPSSGADLLDAELGEDPAEDFIRVLRAHEERMSERGNELIKFRGHASESVNAHLKQHGLSRFHVRGLTRCATVLTLACIAHNLMKWSAREAASLMRLAS